MGKIAKQGIFGGQKIAIDKIGKFANSLHLSNKVWDAFGVKDQAEKVIAGIPLTLSDLEILANLNLAALAALVKISRKQCRLNAKPVLYLPLERWLQVEDPFEVISRSIRYIDNLAMQDLVLVLGIKDFANLDLMWPEIVNGIQTDSVNLKIMGPSFSELVKWCRTKLKLVERADILERCDSLLVDLTQLGIKELFGYCSIHGSPLMRKNKLVLNYACELDRYSDDNGILREFFRLFENQAELKWQTWTVTYSAYKNEITHRDLYQIFKFLTIGSLLFKDVQIRAPWILINGSEINMYSQLGVDENIFLAVDSYTSKSLHLYELNHVKANLRILE